MPSHDEPARRTAASSLVAGLAYLARSRLAQFLVIGSALFALAPRPTDERRIEISARQLAIVQAAEVARPGAREPGEGGPEAVRARMIEDELLYREGVRLGLDREDPLIRQRVIQKMLLLAEDLAGASREPSEAELRAEYQRTLTQHRQPPRYHVMHVFAATAAALPALAQLAALDPARLPSLGEPFPLPRETWATLDELARSYGADFAAAVAARPPSSRYGEPVASTFGWHRLRVVELAAERELPFEEVARSLAFQLTLQRRKLAVRQLLIGAAARYDVVVAGAPLRGFAPSERLARQEASSGED
jgi:peptidyl-prolyl cis-trans isomerase C